MNFRKLYVTAWLIFLGACTGIPEGIEPVTGFDQQRYLGSWHEVARLDHSFERGLTQVSAQYSIRDDGAIRVLNRGLDNEIGEWSEAEGVAKFVGSSDVAHLKVSFFGPFYGGYNILELDKDDYQYALIAGPDRSYLWILARSPELSEDVLSALVNKAKDLEFPVDELIYVDHTTP